ncbi:hypothetical protein ACF07Y_46390 [Streptomyces sp. NPDC016566]|uniref:hypothetical protein n=1 Tax=Streptomyces sp. NPDC016566 TaxID=3364967 RepID=UPI003701F26E
MDSAEVETAMSVYELTCHSEDPAERVAIAGWDASLSTYFAHIFDEDADGETIEVVWIGATPYEVLDPDVVVDAVRPYALLPEGFRDALDADSVTEGEGFIGRPGTRIVTELASHAGVMPDRSGRGETGG